MRRHPADQKRHQLVIIDHGLYIGLPDPLRQQYCELWQALLLMDTPTVERIARSWGFAAQTDLFASATLLQPFKMHKKGEKSQKQQEESSSAPSNAYDSQRAFKDRLKTFLENEQLVPRELIFLTRCMRMLQATNQMLGSPVNRINLLADSAVKGLAVEAATSRHTPVLKRISALLKVVRFRLTLLGELFLSLYTHGSTFLLV